MKKVSRSSRAPQKNAPGWGANLLAGLILVVVALAAYWPAMHAGYIWDDDFYVTENDTLRSADGLRQMWLSPLSIPQYYPLTHTTYWIEYHLWEANPAGYHVDNVLLHVANALLLWRLLARLNIPGALLAACIFAIHPVHVESVAWVTERKNTLSALFYFLAFHAYLNSGLTQMLPRLENRPRWGFYALALVAFIGALLSKSVSASLPAAILVIVWWKTGKVRFKDVLPLVPLFVLGAAMGAVTGWIERHHVGAQGPDWQISLVSRFLIACHALWFYAGKLLLPYNLTFIYPRWHVSPANAWDWTWPALLALALLAAWWVRARWRGPLAGCLFFVGTLFPALGFVNIYPMKYSFVADHFQYVASLGLIVPIAALAWMGLKRFWQPVAVSSTNKTDRRWLIRPLSVSIISAVVLALGLLTFTRALAFADEQTLWRDTIARNPQDWMSRTNLAKGLAKEGKLDEAIAQWRAAMTLRPDEPIILNSLGPVLVKVGQKDEGLACVRKSVDIAPNDSESHYRLGVVYGMLGDFDKAIAELRESIRLKPDNETQYVRLGAALARTNQYAAAVCEYRKAIALDPGDIEALYNLGTAYLQLRDLPAALEAFGAAHELDPNDPRPCNGKGIVLLQERNGLAAAEQFRAALALRPDSREYEANLNRALRTRGN